MAIRTLTPTQDRIIDVMVRWVVDAGEDHAQDEGELTRAVRSQFRRHLSRRRVAGPHFTGNRPGEALSIIRGLAVGGAVVIPSISARHVRSKVSYALLTTHRGARFRVVSQGEGCVLERLA